MLAPSEMSFKLPEGLRHFVSALEGLIWGLYFESFLVCTVFSMDVVSINSILNKMYLLHFILFVNYIFLNILNLCCQLRLLLLIFFQKLNVFLSLKISGYSIL